jgi:hypothetical protein
VPPRSRGQSPGCRRAGHLRWPLVDCRSKPELV